MELCPNCPRYIPNLIFSDGSIVNLCCTDEDFKEEFGFGHLPLVEAAQEMVKHLTYLDWHYSSTRQHFIMNPLNCKPYNSCIYKMERKFLNDL